MTVHENFYNHVSILMKTGEAVLADLDPHKARMLHVMMGIEGELREFYDAFASPDFDNLAEEIGDLEFYIAEALMAIGKTEDDVPSFDYDAYVDGHITVPCFIDIVKKYAIYGKELNVDGVLLYISYVLNEMRIGRMHHPQNLTREAVMSQNIEKLKKRYPAGYTNAAAVARADKTDE